jgi:hypothetical protein
MSDPSEQYCRIDARGFPVNTQVLIMNSVLNVSAFVERGVADVFFSCNGFRTIHEHAAEYVRRAGSCFRSTPAPEVTTLTSILGDLVAAGFFLSRSYWHGVMSQVSPYPTRGRSIGTIAIVTKDRPRYIRRCLNSIIDNLNDQNRECEICVYDDSAGSETLDELKSFRKAIHTSRIAIRYAGKQQKNRFIAQLSRSGDVPPAVLTFALKGMPESLPSYGANLNSLLLDTPGSLVVCLDDDVICELGVSPNFAEGLSSPW